IDSKGCVFLRSGSGWVPRVRRDRSQICTDATVASAPASQPLQATVIPITPVASTTANRMVTPVQTAATAVVASPQPRRIVRVPRSLTHGTLERQDYKLAWTDGRLNPKRGLPATVTAEPASAIRFAPPSRLPTPVAKAPVTGQGVYVQVATFGVPANATRSANRLQAAGLPAQIRAKGRFSVLRVGPFSSASSAQSALIQVRQSGFSDAFVSR
ncbi:MAG: SPOR domain-containing protein, partial [Pseudomonadota bacterium]